MRRTLLLASLVVVALSGAAVMRASGARDAVDPGCAPRWWPQPRQNSCANGSATNAQAPSPANVARLEVAWAHRAEGPAPGYPREVPRIGQPIVWAGPVMRAPYVYVVAGERLRAFELATGRLRWEAKAGIAPFDGTEPVADGDLLLRAGLALRRYVLRSGHLVWRRGGIGSVEVGMPVVADGVWYQFWSGFLDAADARTGKDLWDRSFDCNYCGVAATGGRVYAAGDPEDTYGESDGGGALYALDARTGETLWSARTLADYDIGVSPVVADGRVFVRTAGRRERGRKFSIEAFRASDGKHLWHASVGTREDEGIGWTPPAADADLVVYPSEDGSLYALDAATGKLRWRVPQSSNDVRPAIVNGLVWAGDSALRIVALDARDGRRLWASPSFEPRSPPSPGFKPRGPHSPVLAGDFVLIGTHDGRLLAYHVAP